jgi:hypothetical protein
MPPNMPVLVPEVIGEVGRNRTQPAPAQHCRFTDCGTELILVNVGIKTIALFVTLEC